MAKMIFMVDGVGGQYFDLASGTLTIGRAADNDIHIDDLAVSNAHAVIERKEDENFPGHVSYRVRDLGSTNGTFVNDVQVASKQLSNSDIVRVGWSNFKFVDESQPSLDTTAYILPGQAG